MDARIEIPTGHAGLLLCLWVSDYPSTHSRLYLHAALRRRRDYQALASAGTTNADASLCGDSLVIDGCHFSLQPKRLHVVTEWLRDHGVTVRDHRQPAQEAA